MRPLATICAALLTTLPGVAHAAQQPCLSPAEASSLAAYALPAAITGTAKRCTPSLPASAFLRTGGTALATRYAAQKAQAWPSAKAAFFKMSSARQDQSADLLKSLPDPSLQQMVDAIIEGMVAQQIPTENCGQIDRAIGLLAPLAPQSTAELMALALGLASKSGNVKNDLFSICQS